MLILPRPRFTQPQQGWAVAREYRAHLSGLMLPSLGLTALTGQAVTRVGANGFIGGSLHEAAWRHTDTASFYCAPIVNTTLNDSDGPAVACLGRFRLRQAPGADRSAIFGLGSSVGEAGNTLFITGVDTSNNIAVLCGTRGSNPGWDYLGVNAGDFQWHTVLMEAFTSASGFTFVKRFSIDGKVLPEIAHPGNGGSLPYDFLCALGSRRTVDFGGELHADVSLVAGWIFPKLGDHFFTEDQASRLTRNPYAELFAPVSRRLWVPGGAPSGLTVLAGIGAATASGLTANISRGLTISAGVGAAAATGQTASISLGRTVLAGVGASTAAGLTAGISLGRTISAGLGAATAEGLTASIETGSGTIVAGVGQAAASSRTAGISLGLTIGCGVGAAEARGLPAQIIVQPIPVGPVGYGDMSFGVKEPTRRKLALREELEVALEDIPLPQLPLPKPVQATIRKARQVLKTPRLELLEKEIVVVRAAIDRAREEASRRQARRRAQQIRLLLED